MVVMAAPDVLAGTVENMGKPPAAPAVPPADVGGLGKLLSAAAAAYMP